MSCDPSDTSTPRSTPGAAGRDPSPPCEADRQISGPLRQRSHVLRLDEMHVRAEVRLVGLHRVLLPLSAQDPPGPCETGDARLHADPLPFLELLHPPSLQASGCFQPEARRSPVCGPHAPRSWGPRSRGAPSPPRALARESALKFGVAG